MERPIRKHVQEQGRHMRAVAADANRRAAASTPAGFVRRVSLAGLLAVRVCWASGASLADPGKVVADGAAKAAPPAAEKKKAEPKLYAFSMDKKPWGSVFTWLTDRTGK